ncbi:MAG TPA: hypothetical protein VIJ14_08730 [Rhabdochlamydiaceae bacterium]
MLRVIQAINLFLIFILGAADLSAGGDPRKNEWQHTKYIWNFGLISLCDKGVPPKPIQFFEGGARFVKSAYQNIRSGDIVWVNARYLPQFSREVLPEVKHPFVLVIADGDESFPTDSGLSEVEMEALISHDKIIHIFAQNYDDQGKFAKVSHIPIGMDFHTVGYKSASGGWGERGPPLQQEAYLSQLLGQLQPTYLRKRRAFVDFQVSDTIRNGSFKRYLQLGEDRTSIFHYLLMTGLIDYSGRIRRSELWNIKGQYAFSISPHGNGLDCHRTWEDLVLGCIVIVKTSSLDPLYEGLPVVIVKDWSEITDENLEKWLDQYRDAFTNPEYRSKLTNGYWFDKIRAAAAPYRGKR